MFRTENMYIRREELVSGNNDRMGKIFLHFMYDDKLSSVTCTIITVYGIPKLGKEGKEVK